MSPPFPTRAVFAVVGVSLLIIYLGVQANSKNRRQAEADWEAFHGVRHFSGVSRYEPSLPPGQAIFAIALDAKSEQFEKGQRIDVFYQEEADTSSFLIVQDVPIHSTYRPCGKPYPKVELLLAQEDVDRLSNLEKDGGKLIMVRHKPAEVEVPVAPTGVEEVPAGK